MAVQRVRLWQWILLSLVVGAIFGYVWTDASTDQPTATTWEVRKFANAISRKTETGEPIIRDIVIEPMRSDAQGKLVQRVRFSVYSRNVKTNSWDPVEEASLTAHVPFIAAAPHADYRVGDWLKEKRADWPALKYSYAWWKVSGLSPEALAKGDRELMIWQKPKIAWITAMVISVLLVGVIWPMVIKLLVKMGLGQPEEETEPGVDLSKVRSTSSFAQPATAGVTDADLSELDSLNARLEDNVAGMLMSQDELDEAEERRAEEAVVRKLEAQRLESQASDLKPEDPKDYKGEFYPVARPVVKKED